MNDLTAHQVRSKDKQSLETVSSSTFEGCVWTCNGIYVYSGGCVVEISLYIT